MQVLVVRLILSLIFNVAALYALPVRSVKHGVAADRGPVSGQDGADDAPFPG